MRSVILTTILPALLFTTSCGGITDADTPADQPAAQESQEKAPQSADSMPVFADRLVCPESPVPSRGLTLVNFSDLPDEEVSNCFNFALKKIDPWETDVMMVMYPVGPLLLPPGEVKNNDTSFRGAGFTKS